MSNNQSFLLQQGGNNNYSFMPPAGNNEVHYGITAKAAGSQATGTKMKPGTNVVSTVATAGDAVTLPLSTPGMEVTVFNASANSLNVFPGLHDAIGTAVVNTAVAVAAGANLTLICVRALAGGVPGLWAPK